MSELPSRKDPAQSLIMMIGMLMVLIASVVTGYVARDPGRRRRALNRAGRTWLKVEDHAHRASRPLRRRRRRLDQESVRLAEQPSEDLVDLVFPPCAVSVPRVNHRPYAHGAFMGAAPALLAEPRWRKILAFLMPDVYQDVASAVSRGVGPCDLIPMFDNNPVIAAFGASHPGSSPGALEWDVFLSSSLVDGWHAALAESRPQILVELVDTMVIAHASTTDTVQEQIGLCQWGDVRKTPKTRLGGVQFGAWLDLFARALSLSVAEDLSAAIAQMQALPRRHDAEECLKHTFVDEMSPERAVETYLELTGRGHLSVVLEVKSLQIGPVLLRALVAELNTRAVHVHAVGSFQQAEIASVSRMTQSVRGERMAGPLEIVFLHFAGDVQAGCDKGSLLPGTAVMFNGASLLLADKQPERYLYRLDETVLAGLEDYRVRFSLQIGIYVQENDCDSDAVSMLSTLVEERRELFALGFAWGGLQSEVAVAPGTADRRGYGLQRLLTTVGVASRWKPIKV